MDQIERPDHNVLYIWRAEVLTVWGICFVAILGCSIFALIKLDAPYWILAGPVIPAVIGAFNLFLLKVRWERWTYLLTPSSLEMSHGWLVRHKRIVSRNRIQHVDFNSGPIGRKFDLVHVVVHTAGATVGTIPGVRTERAEQLRTELMSGTKTL